MPANNTVLRLIDGYIEKENLISNPSTEIDLAGQSFYNDEGGTGSISRSSVQARYGSWSTLVDTDGTQLTEGVAYYKDSNKTKIPVHEGLPYLFFVWLRAKTSPGDEKSVDVIINWYDKNGTKISNTTPQVSFGIISASSWLLEWAAGIAPIGAVSCIPKTSISGVPANNNDYYADGATLLQTPSMETVYVDGDQPGCQWLGTPHASRSVKGDVNNSIDFINGGVFQLRKEGLDLPIPEVSRIMGGNTLGNEGQQLINKSFDNREIAIRFKIEGKSGAELRRHLNKLQRIIDNAVAAAHSKLASPVVLEWSAESLPEPVLFDIIDGQIDYPDLANTEFARSQTMLNNEVVLTAKPQARSKHVITLNNHIVNADFDNQHPTAGMRGDYYRTFGASGDRLERANCTGLVPAGPYSLTVWAWIYRTSAGALHCIMRAGNDEADVTPLNRGAFQLSVNASNKLECDLFEPDGDKFTLTANSKTIPSNQWVFVAAVFDERRASANDQTWKLYQNGEPIAAKVGATDTPVTGLKQTTGKFTIGAVEDDTERFAGRIMEAGVLLAPLTGIEIVHLMKGGTRSLIDYEESWYTNRHFWGIESHVWGAAWPDFAASGTVSDVGPNSKDLSDIGSVSAAVLIKEPNGWTLGSSITAANGCGLFERGEESISAIARPPWIPRTGRFYFRVKDSSGDANTLIKQTVTVPSHKLNSGQNQWWTVVAVVRSNIDNHQVNIQIDATDSGDDSDTGISDIDIADGWTFLIKTFQVTASSSFDVIIKRTSGTVDFGIDFVGCFEGTPFGCRYGTSKLVYGSPARIRPDTGESPLPTVTSRFMARTEYNTSGKAPGLVARDIPGDQPAGSKLFIHNNLTGVSDQFGKIRVGLLHGGSLGKVTNTFYGAALEFDTDADTYTQYTEGSWDILALELTSIAAGVWEDIAFTPLGSLIPEVHKINGLFRLLGSVSRDAETLKYSYLYAYLKGPFGNLVPLTQNVPRKTETISEHPLKMTDVGSLIWPPVSSLPSLYERRIQGRVRFHDSATNEISPANVSIMGFKVQYLTADKIWFTFLDIISAENGFGELSSETFPGRLFPEETLVIDSITPSLSSAYTIRQPSIDIFDGEDRITNIESAASIMWIGDTFNLTPDQENLFTIMGEKEGSVNLEERPRTTADSEALEAYLAYEARYLYV
jgi:hypothetical protein